MKTLLVLTPPGPGDPGARRPPQAMPLGRAALTLAAERRAEVIFVSEVAERGPLRGLCADASGGWREVERPVAAVDGVYDRFPSQSRPELYARLCDRLQAVTAWINAPAAIALCRDKLASQRVLTARGVAMPALVEVDGDGHVAAQRRWSGGYLKPRFGSFGAGVRRVGGTQPLPRRVAGLVAGREEPALLQRAVEVPALELDGRRVCGLSVRVLVQREAGGWVAPVAVARVSTHEEVANVATGAVACALRDLLCDAGDTGTILSRVHTLAIETATALQTELDETRGGVLGELGVDLVFDPQWRPWVIEVNGKPAGHLAALARRDRERFGRAQREASLRPLRWLCQPSVTA